MDAITRTNLDNVFSQDRDLRNAAYSYVIEATDQPVDWAYEVWDKLVAGLRHEDNHVRAIASQALSNLAKSDPDKRMLKDFEALLAVTKDAKFVTARHCLQSLWKVGIAGKPQQQTYLDGLTRRFNECSTEKNCTLIRFDIIQSLRNVYDVIKDDNVKQTALALIETEPDIKYQKKYASLWKK